MAGCQNAYDTLKGLYNSYLSLQTVSQDLQRVESDLREANAEKLSMQGEIVTFFALRQLTFG